MPHLVVESPEGQRQRLPLEKTQTTLGRDRGCDVCLPDPKISRKHAILRRAGDTWTIEDLGSVNGYVLDGTARHGISPLRDGSRIGLGEYRLTFENPVQEASQAQPGWQLRVEQGALRGLVLALAPGEHSIGRSGQADLVLDDPSISRQHAGLVVGAAGVTVRDLGSSNGTFIEGVQLHASQTRLEPGQALRCGNVYLRLEMGGEQRGQTGGRPELSVASHDIARDVRARLPALGREDAQAGEGSEDAAAGAAGPGRAGPGQKQEASKGDGARFSATKLRARASATASRLAATGRHARATKWTALGAVVLTFAGLWRGRDHLPTQRARSVLHGVHLASLLGRGPSQEERSFCAQLESRLAAASAKFEAGEFAEAAQLYGEVLVTEPVSSRASAGRRLALIRLGQSEDLAAAKRELEAGHPFEALVAASSGLVRGRVAAPTEGDGDEDGVRAATALADEGEEVAAAGAEDDDGAASAKGSGGKAAAKRPPAGRSQGPQPMAREAAARPAAESVANDAELERALFELADKSAERVAQICGERAQAACAGQAYANCVQQAACVAAFAPDSELSPALLALTADAVGSTKAGPERNAAEAASALAAAYPLPRVRRAMLAYGVGSLASARKQLANLGSARGVALQADVAQVADLSEQASKAEQAGDWQAALGLYQQAIGIDKRLLPHAVPNVARQDLVHRAQRILLQKGEQARAGGHYADALSNWERGLSLDGRFVPLQRARAALRARAEHLLQEAGEGGRAGTSKAAHGKDPCQAYKDAAAMTHADDGLHKKALAELASCTRHRGRSQKAAAAAK